MEEEIIAGSYWENFKYLKDLSDNLGGQHPKTEKQRIVVNDILKQWNAIKTEKDAREDNE